MERGKNWCIVGLEITLDIALFCLSNSPRLSQLEFSFFDQRHDAYATLKSSLQITQSRESYRQAFYNPLLQQDISKNKAVS